MIRPKDAWLTAARALLLLVLLALLGAAVWPAGVAAQTGAGTPSRTPTLTRTPTLSRTPTLTRTPSPTRTPTITRTPSPGPTSANPTATESATALPSDTVTPTPPPTSAATRTPTLVPGPDTYTVQPGDTLAKIAAKFGVRLADLATVNNLALETVIYVGQILRIPPRPPTPTAPPLTVPAGYTTYTVKAGDTLLPIARAFGVTTSQLRSANSLNSDTIYPGQVLLIPPRNTPTRTRTPFPANAITYVVKPGDQLLRIARAFGVPLSQLKTTNNLASDTISPGRVLLIPTVAPTRTPAPPTRTPTGAFDTYVVKPGDRLSRIAVWYGVTLTALRAANGLSSDSIAVGRLLTIPSPTRYPLRYVVQPSDNLTRIADRYETTVANLQLANGMGNNTTIFEGLVLIVPAKRP